MTISASRAAASVLALSLALSAAACDGDRSTATGPTASVRMQAAAPAAQLGTALKRAVPLQHDVTYSATVGSSGGVIRIPEAGLQLVIPRNALPGGAPITISVTAVAGDAVAYEFEPHGVVFDTPLTAIQDLRGTTWSNNTGNSVLEAGYFASSDDLDVASGTALLSDWFPTTVTATGKRLHWGVPHFSGYVIVTGKRPTGI